ncbi:hypothetical protein ARMSODRAFT_988805 [Armillaria solidipes]|uniref:Uncharacterized protein n=1 Tax=Armillaria solidipes TaxID=1076256 RepID=A0A2H3BZ78_9AGAR|nr:hypothetical protein ARMSODRAFT_988805 [Armillaria solidipes]
MSNVPTWDGNGDTIINWLLKVNNLSLWSKSRLTREAERWYYSLPFPYRIQLEQSWGLLCKAIINYYMNRLWWERQKDKAHAATQYYIRKSEMLNTTFDLLDSELIAQVMNSAPAAWSTVLTTQLYQSTVEFQSSIRYHEDQLLRLDPNFKGWNLNAYESRLAQER